MYVWGSKEIGQEKQLVLKLATFEGRDFTNTEGHKRFNRSNTEVSSAL